VFLSIKKGDVEFFRKLSKRRLLFSTNGSHENFENYSPLGVQNYN